jgi:hypothetical protein
LIPTTATVWGGRIWFKLSETLIIATGDSGGGYIHDDTKSFVERYHDARRHHLQRRAGHVRLDDEFVRDEIRTRRESLRRHAGHDDSVVVVKASQSA